MASPRRRSLFVTGTDTGVGKTLVSTAIVSGLRDRGLDVGAMKPAETGVDARGPLDAQALREAAGGVDALDSVCPYRFEMPAAPNVAARAEGRSIGIDPIRRAFGELSRSRDLVVVEGAGGLLVPLNDALDMAGLAHELALPVLVVARAALGTINHTLLTLREIERRDLECLGVVISHASGELSPADAANLDELRRRLGARLLGEIPPIATGAAAPPDSIDLERLDAALTQDAQGP